MELWWQWRQCSHGDGSRQGRNRAQWVLTSQRTILNVNAWIYTVWVVYNLSILPFNFLFDRELALAVFLCFHLCTLVSWGSEATPSATQFSKGLRKLAIFPDYERPGLVCLALPPCLKFGVILNVKLFLDLKLSQNVHKTYYSERFGWFLIWKIHFESPIFASFNKLAKLGKASQDAYNQGKWLIL